MSVQSTLDHFLPSNHQQFLMIFCRANPGSSPTVLCQLDAAREEEGEGEATLLWGPRIRPFMPKWTKEESVGDRGRKSTCSTHPRIPQFERWRETISQWRPLSSPVRTVGPRQTLKNLNIMEWRGSSMMIERVECKTGKQNPQPSS